MQVPCAPGPESPVHVSTLCPLLCRTLTQDMSGDVSACPGKLLLSALPSGVTVLCLVHDALVLWRFARFVFLSRLGQRSDVSGRAL